MFINENLHNAYIIAEAEINHNGHLQSALKMVEQAKKCGADAIKFQYIVAEEIATQDSPYFEIFKKVELDHKELHEIVNFSKTIGIECFFTVPSIGTLDKVLDLEPQIIKVGSTNLTNTPLLEEIGKTGLPVILSTGLGTIGEIETAIKFLNAPSKNIAILHCTVSYPAPLESCNLKTISTLKAVFPNNVIGFSDHTEGEWAAIASVGLGARIFEKHFTLDRLQEGPDHGFSEDPEGLSKYVKAIHDIEKALGDGIKKPSDLEIPMIGSARRYLVSAKNIKKGSIFRETDFSYRRVSPTVTGIEPSMSKFLVGWQAPKSYGFGDPISWNDFKVSNHE